uniref:Uncharacterized protein n=1 Tax=Clytia hemisphaerica TaxID=252671 RepID=A0A7M5WLH9_9CNID
MLKLLALLCLIGVCVGYTIEKNPQVTDNEWHVWRVTHKKAYKDLDEERVRYAIWKDNVQYINEFNAQNKHMKLKINHFGDYTNLEFRYLTNGLRVENRTSKATSFLQQGDYRLPDSVDWRSKGYVTPVKNQGVMGQCWTFSVTGAFEGQQFKKTGKLVSLSEQNLADCVKGFGSIDNGYNYVIENGGLDTAEGYPGPGKVGECRFNPNAIGVTCTGWADLLKGDESALQKAVALTGPIAVGFDASHRSFQFYSSGVYSEPDCSASQIDHTALVVGYGSEDGTDYWIVKNSWGTSWGEKGYVKMRRNFNNMCGIATMASYPYVGR